MRPPLVWIHSIGLSIKRSGHHKEGTVAHPNEEVVRTGYEAFSRGDMDTLRGLFVDDVVWHVPGRSPLAGDHRGVDAVLGYFGQTMELTGGTFQVELHDVVANDHHTVGLHIARGQRSGKNLEDHQVLVFHFRDGQIAEVWQLVEDVYANDNFFS
jgi:ketosteroid isomerase-like protein